MNNDCYFCKNTLTEPFDDNTELIICNGGGIHDGDVVVVVDTVDDGITILFGGCANFVDEDDV